VPACAAEIGPGRLRGVGLKRSLRFALGLGSNSGDRERALCDAIRLLAVDERVSDLRLSGLYETEPWGGVEGGAFLNAVAVASFRGSGEALRDLCRAVEISCGSSIEKAGRSRRLDLDILFLDPPAVVPGLEIPHPGMALRRFVLVPLTEVWSGQVPGMCEDPASLLASCPDQGHISQLRNAPEHGGLWLPCPNRDT